jgi:hypothetical protein
MLAELRGSEGEDDPILGDPGLDELCGDAVLGAIPLDPQLALDQVDVDQGAMDTLALIPPHVHQEVTVTGAIKNCLGLNLTIGIRDERVLGEDSLHDFTIAL